MPQYRCYHVGVGSHFVGLELFEVSSDSEACIRATEIAVEKSWLGHELWELGRKVDCSGFMP